MNIVKKLKLVIITEDKELRNNQYKFIRDSQYAQYKVLNITMGHKASAYFKCNKDFNSQEYKEFNKNFKFNKNNPAFEGIKTGKGIDTLSSVKRKVDNDLKNAIKNGLAKGERSIPNYKRTFPLLITSKSLKFYMDDKCNVYIKWVNGITFKVILGAMKNKEELLHTINKVIEDKNILDEIKDKDLKKEMKKKLYSVSESSMYFNKDNELILNLNLSIPNKSNNDFIPNRVVGVDLGVNIPAYCSINDKPYVRQAIGCKEDLLCVRQQFRERRRRLQKRLGLFQGYKKKYNSKELSNLNEKESNYARTYTHMITKRIIEFAKKNNAGQINLELLDIEQGKRNGELLSIWGYSQLQRQLEYKAEREGIVVKYIDPYKTSQICSCCGHYEAGQRRTQEEFICKNPKCNNYNKIVNADYNASQNISKSTNYVSSKEECQYYINLNNRKEAI